MMAQRPHHELEELLGAYALDAVDSDERDLVDAHLTTCPRCRSEVEHHREVASLLGHQGEAAPPGVWDRIAAELEETPPRLELPATGLPVPTDLGRERERRRGRVARAASGLMAVAASIAIVALVVQVQRLNDQLGGLERERDVAVAMAERGYAAAVDGGDSVVVDLVSDDGALDARAVLAPDGTGYLRGVTLPRLPEGRTYPLWGVTEDERVISLGVFGAHPDYEVFPAADRYVAFALTEEVSGGVVVSDQPALVVGEVGGV